MMVFHEIYGGYYRAVARIITLALHGELTEAEMKAAADSCAFSESFLEIIPPLKNGSWQLISPALKTALKHEPTFSQTEIELRWLKTITLDKRFSLFEADTAFLDNIEPLFSPEDYVLFDKYGDGDPFENERYIEVFRTLLRAIKEHKRITVEYKSNKGNSRRITCDPYKLEYSEKDDKFRVCIANFRHAHTLLVGGIECCEIIGDARKIEEQPHSDEWFIAELIDERNALERFLLAFSHFRKEALQLDEKHYRIKIYYDREDETELLIRILSFGQFIRVTEPEGFIELIRQRLIAQKACGLR